jgi:hypothetical protein
VKEVHFPVAGLDDVDQVRARSDSLVESLHFEEYLPLLRVPRLEVIEAAVQAFSSSLSVESPGFALPIVASHWSLISLSRAKAFLSVVCD